MKKNTILVVDDSTVMRQLASEILEAGGYRTLLARDGEEALAQVRKGGVDLVLTDWTMIPMDGGELTRQLRLLTVDVDEPTPILVLSTGNSERNKAEARKAGANGWLCKPIDPETLLAVVGSLMRVVDP